MDFLTSAEFWVALGQVIVIDIALPPSDTPVTNSAAPFAVTWSRRRIQSISSLSPE